jgi:hypothetical protein
MTLEQLKHYQPGSQVTACCQLSDKSIAYRSLDETDRHQVPVTDEFTRKTRYTVSGQVIGVEEGDKYDFFVLRLFGEAAVIAQVRSGLKVIGTEMRTKIARVPVSAILRVDSHPFGL